MQLLLLGMSLATAMASLAATTQQNAVNQPEISGVHVKGEVSLSLADFVNQKKFQKRQAYLTEWKNEISPPKLQHRHKASLTAFATQMHHGSRMHQRLPPPIEYIPKIGVGNVTTPTELPPPPPTLNPMTDQQPLDTAIGNAIASSFLAPPTETPPPTQEALNLAYGCPVLLGYPSTLQINAPSGCTTARDGNWTHPQGQQVIKWDETCDIRTSVLPVVTYTLPDGQAFASSRTRFSFFGNTMEILDCGDNLQFTIEEKIYHQTKFTDQAICKRYGSCTGTIFLQYFLRDKLGHVIAETPYVNLFQDEYVIQEPGSGLPIATVQRVGSWSPWEVCPEWGRMWAIKSALAPPGIFANPEGRWPIAIMFNMIILRDADRTKSGMVMPSTCEIINVTIIAFFVLLIIIGVIVSSLLFHHFLYARAKLFFYNIEVNFFPHTMYKPTKYEG